jgi:hypothetical protein
MTAPDAHNPKPHELFATLKSRPAGERSTPGPGIPSDAAAGAPSPTGTTSIEVGPDSVVARHPDVTGRRIADKYILVPLKRGMGEDNHLYTCNGVGRDCWEALDGESTLREVAATIAAEFEGADPEVVLRDLIAFVEELATISAVRVR